MQFINILKGFWTIAQIDIKFGTLSWCCLYLPPTNQTIAYLFYKNKYVKKHNLLNFHKNKDQIYKLEAIDIQSQLLLSTYKLLDNANKTTIFHKMIQGKTNMVVELCQNYWIINGFVNGANGLFKPLPHLMVILTYWLIFATKN